MIAVEEESQVVVSKNEGCLYDPEGAHEKQDNAEHNKYSIN